MTATLSSVSACSINSLPTELIDLILTFLVVDRSDLVRLLRTSQQFSHSAHYSLLSNLFINQLRSFDQILSLLQASSAVSRKAGEGNNASTLSVRSIKIHQPSYSQEEQGWNQRINKLLLLTSHHGLRSLELIGLNNFRLKSLCCTSTISLDGAEIAPAATTELRTLIIRSTSFKPHSLPHPANLAFALSKLTSLTLSNLGLPYPSTHLSSLLSSSPKLTSLHLSSLRDLTSPLPSLLRTLFLDPLQGISSTIVNLRIGALSIEQEKGLVELLSSMTALRSFEVGVGMMMREEALMSTLPSCVEKFVLARRRRNGSGTISTIANTRNGRRDDRRRGRSKLSSIAGHSLSSSTSSSSGEDDVDLLPQQRRHRTAEEVDQLLEESTALTFLAAGLDDKRFAVGLREVHLWRGMRGRRKFEGLLEARGIVGIFE